MMSRTQGPYPPVIVLICIGLQLALHKWYPLALLVPDPWNLAGAVLVAGGILIVAMPAASFSQADTTIKPFQESSALVTGGMYRFTRNPMYLGMLTVLIGIAFLAGSLSPFIAPVIFVPILNQRVIRHEEAMLEERFGDEYRDFTRRVRRWI